MVHGDFNYQIIHFKAHIQLENVELERIEIGNAILYHGDCADIIDSIDTDITLTDPPYGMNYESSYYSNGNPFGSIQGDHEMPLELLDKCFMRSSYATYIFCRWNNLPQMRLPDSFIVWVKNNHSAGDLNHEYGRCWEGIAFYAGLNHKFNKRPIDVIHFDRVIPTQIGHPTAKPVGLIELLISHNEGQTVFDPFMGSGTTGVACMNLGRKFIGCEIDRKYFDIAVERIENAQKQLRLLP